MESMRPFQSTVAWVGVGGLCILASTQPVIAVGSKEPGRVGELPKSAERSSPPQVSGDPKSIQCPTDCSVATAMITNDLDADGIPEIVFWDRAASIDGMSKGVVCVGSIKTKVVKHLLASEKFYHQMGPSMCVVATDQAGGKDQLIVPIFVPPGYPLTPETLPARFVIRAIDVETGLVTREGPVRAPLEGSGIVGIPDLITPIGDVDGDGKPDLAAAFYLDLYKSCEESIARGSVFIVSTDDFRVLARTQLSERPGIVALVGIEDIDKDGVVDIAIGEPNAGQNNRLDGKVRLCSGRDLATMVTCELPQESQFRGSPEFGTAIALCRDMNADGMKDIVVTGWDSCIAIVSGKDGRIIHGAPTPNKSGARLDGFGESVACLATPGGGAASRIAVGMHRRGWGPDGNHAVYLYETDLANSRRVAISEDHRWGLGQTRVVAFPDVDDDGYEEVLAIYPLKHQVVLLSGATGAVLDEWYPLLGSNKPETTSEGGEKR